MKWILACFTLLLTLNVSGQNTYNFGTDSDSARYYFNQGWHQIMDLGLWTQSEASFRKAVDFDDDFLLGKSLVGRITQNLTERQEHSKEIALGIRDIDQDGARLLTVFLGSMQAMNARDQGLKLAQEEVRERFFLAEENLRLFVHKYPGNAYIKAEYIEILHRNKGAKSALDSLYSLATEEQLDLPFYMSYASFLEGELGHFDRAEDLIEKLEAFPNATSMPSLYKTYHDIYLASDELEKAYEEISKAIELDSNHMIAIYDRKMLQEQLGILLDSESLRIQQIAEGSYVHTSYLETQSWGRIGCNGLIVHHGKEAVVVDTPVDNAVSEELMSWIKEELESTVVAVVPTHFHVDCLGGLEAFHSENVTSIANSITQDLASKKSHLTFENMHEVEVGEQKLILFYPGEGHTKDNIVAYYEKDSVLFGGCLVKSIGAGKGNLADANVETWSESAENVKAKFSQAQNVVPGHGRLGSKSLLDFTIQLFEEPIILDELGREIRPDEHPGVNGKSQFEVVANVDRQIDYLITEFENDFKSIVVKEKGSKVFEFVSKSESENIDLEEIDSRRAEWIKLCNNNNAKELIGRVYSNDAIYYNHKPLLRGNEELVSEYAYMNRPEYELFLEPVIVEPVNSSIVFEVGQCSGSYGGKYILVWKKNDDGVWRIFMDSNI